MNCKLFCAVILVFVLLEGKTQTWFNTGGGLQVDEVLDNEVLSNNHTIVAGYFAGNCNFGNSAINTVGNTDGFIARLNAQGQYLWSFSIGSQGPDKVMSVAVDRSGYILATGFFSQNISIGSFNLVCSGDKDVFVVKLDPSGNLVWAESFGGMAEDLPHGITVDQNFNIALCGEYSNAINCGVATLNSAGGVDGFVMKLDSSGVPFWAKGYAGALNDRLMDCEFDQADDLLITGQFSNNLDFNGITYSNNIINALSTFKVGGNGQTIWFRKIGAGLVNMVYRIKTDLNNNVYLAGDFQGVMFVFENGLTPVFQLDNPLPNRIFVVKYNATGTPVWGYQAGSANEIGARGLAVTQTGEVFVGGHFTCTLSDYNAQYGQASFRSLGFRDIFLTKLAENGSWQYSRNTGYHHDDFCWALDVYMDGRPFLSGSFKDKFICPNVNNGYFFPGQQFLYGSSIVSSCNDPNYFNYSYFSSEGNSDFFFGSFLTDAHVPLDYYYRSGSSCLMDTLPICILHCDSDTALFCGPSYSLSLDWNRWSGYLFPNYSILWSNGDTTDPAQLEVGGQISVSLATEDGCYSQSDNIFITLQQVLSPPISDSYGYNNYTNTTQPIPICYGDSVLLMGFHTDTFSYFWVTPLGDTLQEDSIWASDSGDYEFFQLTGYICPNSTRVLVRVDSLLGPASFYMLYPEDTVGICYGTMLNIVLEDTIYSHPIANINTYHVYLTNRNTGDVEHEIRNSQFFNFYVSPNDSGMYDLEIIVIRQNACGIRQDTVIDSVFVYQYPNPPAQVAISGEHWLCPGDTAYLVATGTPPFYWGNGFTGDSLMVTQPNNYYATTSQTNQYGCTNYDQDLFVVEFKPYPVLSMTPENGIICPFDSVLLSVNTLGTYSWDGPSGVVLNPTSYNYTVIQGTFQCEVIDSVGCALVTNTVEVVNYTTPYILVYTPNFCYDTTTTLYLITNNQSVVQWQSPLSGNSLTQVVSDSGTYYCEVTQCGITTMASTTVSTITPSFNVSFSQALPICDGDSVLVTLSDPAFNSYFWPSLSTDTNAIWVYQQSELQVLVRDTFSCQLLDTIQVDFFTNNAAPPAVLTDTTICLGLSLDLLATGPDSIFWYGSSLGDSIIQFGPSIHFDSIVEPFGVWVGTLLPNGCRSPLAEVQIDTLNCMNYFITNGFSPNGDGQNEYFRVEIPQATAMLGKIYDRWGKLIAEFDLNNPQWDGRNLAGQFVEEGTYFYRVNFNDVYHNSYNKAGYVTLWK
jgi:gliding motility-associated-like protein